MDLKAMGIMNEVDELLGKLDTLPDDVRLEVLKKLSRKVSDSQLSAPKKSRSTNKEQQKAPKKVLSCVPSAKFTNVTIKKEPEEGTEDVNKTDAVVVSQNESLTSKTDEVLPQRDVVSGRRQTKKVDYKHLSEFGVDDDIDTEIITNNSTAETKSRPLVKRGRGRPRKNPEVPVSTASNGSFDLLESCLKESGIKATSEKPYEQEKHDGSDPGKQPSSKEDLQDDGEEAQKKVFVCSSVDSINVSKKKSSGSKFKCKECGKMYSSLSVLKTHQVRHRKKEDLPFPCKHCDFRSASKIELFRHSLKHEKSLIYSCNICKKEFARDTGLREHIQFVHAKSEVLECGICQFSTHRRNTMRNHLRTHQGTTPVIACPVCGVTLRSKANLRTHLYSHAGLKRFECDICQKKFINRNRVKEHKINVHGPKEHACQYCEMKFPTRHALNRHVLIHTGEKPFQCCFCAFMCNTQGNLIKHIRHVHEKINFTYKDFLRESRKELTPKIENMEQMQKEGKDYASKVFHTIAEATGETLTVEQLKEEVQKKKESKVAALLEQQYKRKRKVVKKSMLNANGKEKKITVYSVPDKSGEAVINASLDDNIYVEDGMSEFGDDNSCWLTHTDENGCIMLIPWNVSLIENDEGDEDEEGEWQQDLQVDKIVKVASTSGGLPLSVSKDEEIRLEKYEDDCNMETLESTLEINRDDKVEKEKPELEVRNAVVEVDDLCEVVDEIDSLSEVITAGASPSISLSSDKKIYKELPKTLQVIDNAAPSVSNFVLPEGYIVDDDGQVLQLTSNVMGSNLLQLQMGHVVNPPDSPEVTIDKFSDNVYSFTDQNSEDKEATLVITTRDKDDEADIQEFGKIGHKPFNANVNLLPMDVEEEEGKQQSALVLIVNADDDK